MTICVIILCNKFFANNYLINYIRRNQQDVFLQAMLRYCDAMLMCKLLGAHWSNFTPVFNVYYKIKGKFVPQAGIICIFNFQINSKRYLACEPIGKRVCLQLLLQIPSSTSILQHCIAILQYCSQKNIRFGSNIISI